MPTEAPESCHANGNLPQFLVHSDFVIMANREDIVTSSTRNQSLRNGLVEVFITAIKEMCQHSQLRFQWMRYLPRLTGYPWGPFWQVFVDRLQERLAEAETLFSRAPASSLRPMQQMRRLNASSLDRNGAPLFADISGTGSVYLSESYESEDLDILQSYGLRWIDMMQIILRAEADVRSASSKMKSPATDSDWHSRAARLLRHSLRNTTNALPYMERIPMIPLSDGRWISHPVAWTTLRLPTTSEGLAVPAGLGLVLVDTDAANNADRRSLFLALGVTQLSNDDVRRAVLGAFENPHGHDLHTSVAFLRFLYLTHPENDNPTTYTNVTANDSSSVIHRPHQTDMFLFGDTTRYSPSDLGLGTDLVHYLHPKYWENAPPLPCNPGNQSEADCLASWKMWLCQHIGIRSQLRLVARSGLGGRGPTISRAVLHVAENLPGRFMGLLRSLWSNQVGDVLGHRDLLEELGGIEVLCETGKQPLREAVLPIPHLKQLSARYLESGESLPFLQLETEVTDDNISTWRFLRSLKVLQNDRVTFHLTVLEAVVAKNMDRSLERLSRIPDLYIAIYAKCIEWSARRREAEELARSVTITASKYVTKLTIHSGILSSPVRASTCRRLAI